MSLCPPFAPFFSFAGITASMVLCAAGACYGTAKAGVAIAGLGTVKPQLVMKGLIPVVMAGIVAIYGLVVSVLLTGQLSASQKTPLFSSAVHLGAGLSVGLCGVASGWAIGIAGDAGVRGIAKEPRLFVGLLLVLIFAEVLGLFGLIVAMLMNAKAAGTC